MVDSQSSKESIFSDSSTTTMQTHKKPQEQPMEHSRLACDPLALILGAMVRLILEEERHAKTTT